MAFCDFCTCEQCRTGEGGPAGYSHAPTADGRHICDVCWKYNVCGRERRKAGAKYGGPPCEDAEGKPIPDCPHRPKLAGPWTTLAEDTRAKEEGRRQLEQGGTLILLYSTECEVHLRGDEALQTWDNPYDAFYVALGLGSLQAMSVRPKEPHV